MTKTNPYEKAERVLGTIFNWFVATSFILMLSVLLLVYPVVQMTKGVIWYEAFAGSFIVLAVFPVTFLIIYLSVKVEQVWNKKKYEWEKKNDNA